MITKPYSLAAVALASVLLVAACGGSSSPSKSPPAKPKTTKTSTAPKPSASTTAPTGSATGLAGLSPAQLKADAKACQSEYTAYSAVLGAAAGYFKNICAAFATGSLANVKAVVTKVCSTDVSSLPAAAKAIVEAGCASFRKAYGG
jgi:hypothetical protein